VFDTQGDLLRRLGCERLHENEMGGRILDLLSYLTLSDPLSTPNDDDIKPLSENYERQLLSAFPGVGLFAGDSIPRFDLVLLDVEEQGESARLFVENYD